MTVTIERELLNIMDHARKIGKTDLPISWTQRPSPPSSISDRPSTVDEEVTEDRRLINWRKWLNDREKHYRYYEKRTCRDREDLLIINDADDYRHKVETKSLIESAGNLPLSTVDKYRGNPAFWITPEFLSNHGNPALPDISITLPRKQMTDKPLIERVALPQLIKEEKGLPMVSNKRMEFWMGNEYLRNREKKLSREIKLLEGQKPDISKLAIKGRRIEPRTTKKITKIPVITIRESETFEPEDNENDFHLLDQENNYDVALMIQDREITFDKGVSLSKSDEKFSNNFTWSLIFDPSVDKSERQILLENRGNCAIKYRWRYGSLGTSFVPPSPQNSPFFFNKNNGMILPREIVELPVWFRSRVPCTATEHWTLTTEPPICRQSLIFRFWGSAVLSSGPDATNRMKTTSGRSVDAESIELYLNRRVRDTKIREIVESIIDNVQQNNLPSVSYGSLFLESEIFRAKNPTHFYHFGLVRELRNIYDDATSTDSPSWSLSLFELRRVLLSLNNTKARNEAMIRFNESCRDSLKPSLYRSIDSDKKTMVYNLLCCFANKFETESDQVAFKCSQREMRNGWMSSEAPGDVSTSTSVTRISQMSSTTPRRKTKKKSRPGQSRTTSKTNISISTNNHEYTEDISEIRTTKKCLLYKEVFRVRIREMLVNTIAEICAVIDTVDNLNPREI